LKLSNHSEAKKSCNGVLKDDPVNKKALFRRAQADVVMKNFQDAINDIKKVLDGDAANVEAKRLLVEAKKGQKEADTKAKSMYSKMCGALGKFKERPNKSSPPVDMDMDEDDDEPMEGDVGENKDSDVSERVDGDVSDKKDSNASEKKDTSVGEN